MKIWRVISILSVIVLIVVILYCINRNVEKSSQEYEKESQLFFYRLNMQTNIDLINKYPQNIKLKKFDKEIIHLYDLINDSPILIFYIMEIGCSSCVEDELKAIYRDFKKSEIKPLIIISQIEAKKLDDLLNKMHQDNFSVYYISHNSLNMIFEIYNPYYFVMHPNRLITNIYIPNVGYEDINYKYRNSVIKMLTKIGERNDK